MQTSLHLSGNAAGLGPKLAPVRPRVGGRSVAVHFKEDKAADQVATQRERNVQKTIENIKLYGAYSASQDKFRKRHGFWLWYHAYPVSTCSV